MPLLGEVAVSPEGARYTSPGQRPGFVDCHTRTKPCKGVTSNLEQNAPGLALVMMEGTSYIEHNYVAPFQGFRLLGGESRIPGWRTLEACLPWASMSRPVGASVRSPKLSCMSLYESHFLQCILPIW
jgi:hypothetical protein